MFASNIIKLNDSIKLLGIKKLDGVILNEILTTDWINPGTPPTHGDVVTEYPYNERVYWYAEISGDAFGKKMTINWINDDDDAIIKSDEEIVTNSNHWEPIDFQTWWIGGIYYLSMYDIDDYRMQGWSGNARIDLYAEDILLGSSNIFTCLHSTCDYWNTPGRSATECIRHGCYYADGCSSTPP